MLCTKVFFKSARLPQLDISDSSLLLLAPKSIQQGFTVTGVQKKLSLHLSKGKEPRLTIVDYPAGYILKPASHEYEHLPEAEDMAMDIAQAMGVKTVPHGLIRNGDTYAYITKRIDRDGTGKGTHLLAMEDFCQLSGRLTEDKYKSSYEQCTSVIKKYSENTGLDLSEFYLRLLVSFIIGNSDMHLKNFSLIETAPGNRKYNLSKAYDLLPVNLLLPEDKDETALTLQGKRPNLKRENFTAFAEDCGIPKAAAKAMIKKCIQSLEIAEEICLRSYISDAQKKSFIQLMRNRTQRLKD